HRVEGSWIVGGVERTPERRIFLERVETRNVITLRDCITRHVQPRSVIYTDSWRGYVGLSEIFNHQTVNHSQSFVDPITGIHTNTIEGTWSVLKVFVKKRNFNSQYLKYYLGIFIFIRNEEIKSLIYH
ncbi:hypothetical protein DMUE_2939, partial [Dictyocoela muelleri]